MIKWTKDGKVDRDDPCQWHELADALDLAVAALRKCKRIGEDDELSWPDSGNQIYLILDEMLRKLGVEP